MIDAAIVGWVFVVLAVCASAGVMYVGWCMIKTLQETEELIQKINRTREERNE